MANEFPEIKIQAPPVAPPARRIPTEATVKAQPEADRRLVQAPDSVQLSPQAQSVSRVRSVVESSPEIRPSRVEEASAQLRAQAPNSSLLNAQLAEKLLTES